MSRHCRPTDIIDSRVSGGCVWIDGVACRLEAGEGGIVS